MESATKPIRKRIAWVDMAKGGAILLVIIGHTIDNPYILGIIFSFHMPLFFILSGYTFHPSLSRSILATKLKQSFKRLVIPAFIIFLLRSFVGYGINFSTYNTLPKIISHDILALIFTSGSAFKIGNTHIGAAGMIWFLVALFTIRSIFDFLCVYIPGKKTLITTLLITAIGWLISKFIFLPFTLDVSMIAIFFFGFGYLLKNFDLYRDKVKIMLITFIIWVTGVAASYKFGHTYFEFATRHYPLFPIPLLVACAASIFFCLLCIYGERFLKLRGLFVILGKYSLNIFIIHAFDFLWSWSYLWPKSNLGVTTCRLIVDLLVFYIYFLLKNKIVKHPILN